MHVQHVVNIVEVENPKIMKEDSAERDAENAREVQLGCQGPTDPVHGPGGRCPNRDARQVPTVQTAQQRPWRFHSCSAVLRKVVDTPARGAAVAVYRQR